MLRTTPTTFAALAVVAVVGLAVVPFVAPAADAHTRTEQIGYDATVPAEYEFGDPPAGGSVRIDGEQYAGLDRALAAATPGDTVVVEGTVSGPVTVETPNVTVAGAGESLGVITGNGDGTVLRVNASNVTLERLWVHDSGYSAADNDAGIWLDGRTATVRDSRLTAVTFGVWVDGVADARIENTTIVGRESVKPLSDRGNGIQLWQATDAVVEDVSITDVRDGIYFSWSSRVEARNNTMWDLRYGVHYMYSDRSRLVDNTAFDNDAGYALMLSEDLTLVGNRAVNNTGESGHGVLLKGVDQSTLRHNELVGNDNGVFLYNSLDNTIDENTVAGNDVGIHVTAGSVDERVVNNTFVGNRVPVNAVIGERVAWNTSRRGNYWADARVVDADDDGVSDVRHRPAGVVQKLLRETPTARVYTTSPAFRTVRLAESALPVIDTPGVVDHHPLADPTTDAWREYYDSD